MGKERSVGNLGPGTRHTPGPWTAVQGQGAHHRDVYIRAGERGQDGEWPAVARCCSSRVGSFATVEANGRLISAAPDLLAACEAALSIHDIYSSDTSKRLTDAVADKLRAAVAKAGGAA